MDCFDLLTGWTDTCKRILTATKDFLLTSIVYLKISVYGFAKAIYNIYFHPLSRFPGPKLAAATKIPIAYASLTGDLPAWLKRLHDEYKSDVVRTSPDELSFINPTAWQDLYSQRQNQKAAPKDQTLFVGIDSIVTANDADHSRLRRILAHAFSDKALREQEPLIQSHVDEFLDGLYKQAEGPSQGRADFALWYSWFTFDVIGDLAFGNSFGCLKDEKFHSWVALIQVALKSVVYISVTMRFPPLFPFLMMCVPKSIISAKNANLRYSEDTVNQRLANKTTNRKDFLSYILKYNDEKGMTDKEIHGNSATLIVAGGETSSGILAGATYLMLTHPTDYQKLVAEIRGSFKTKSEVNIQNVIKLPFFQALIEESFRVYPPALQGQPRKIAPEGQRVCGYWIPGNTGVQLNQFPAYHSASNFKDPEQFVVERWLGDERYADDQRSIMQPFSIGARNWYVHV